MERLIKVGKVQPKNSASIKKSRIGLGFEKLDRNVFDPEKAYDKVAQLGVKWIRIQSGWARTEKVKGEYDFSWLDSIVDNLIKRGIQPWICLCYGNGLYDDLAKEVFGAVGVPPIYTDEAKQAWSMYVQACAERYKEKVNCFEVWNEPDGHWCWKRGVSATEYGNFVIDTSIALKKGNPDAYVIGGAICHRELYYVDEAFKTGMGDYIDAMSFHEYSPLEHLVFERVSYMRGLCNVYKPSLEIIQGESGSQSRSGGNGAMKTGAWTPKKQAKQLLRHTFVNLMTEVKFTSYFSCVDMIEALNGNVNDKASYMDYGYFGVLSADFDEDGMATGDYTPKISYTALQNICSMFSEDIEKVELPVLYCPTRSDRIFEEDMKVNEVTKAGFKKPNGASAYVYWAPTSIMTTDLESTITLEIASIKGDMKLVDMMDGSIYEIPETMIEKKSDTCFILKNIPIKDYPLVLTFGDF